MSEQSSASVTPDFDVRGLLAPRAFPHPVEQLRLAETHLSWLILTGPFAYKIKKSLRTQFIDAATLDRRHYLCQEELRLNRRLAAALYVDVLPITGDHGALTIGGSGKAVEYAVRMRQFDATDELHHLLSANDVSVDEVAELADLLAAFHAGATVASSGDSATHAGRICDIVLDNLAELVALPHETSSAAHVGRIAGWLRGNLDSQRILLDQRCTAGYVRDCHGDLHGGNIVRFNEQLLPFDCLEFNASLRLIDVLDDLAFLVMDLSAHGHNALAMVLPSRYLESSGDYAGLALVPFYAVHRALVRAKVDAISANSLPPRRIEFESRLQRRLRAADYWSTLRQPILVLMHGASGSGKSWLSRQLVPLLPAIRIRSDVERKRLAGLAPAQGTEAAYQAGAYAPQFSQRTYAHMCECAVTALRSGFSTIIDAAFLDAANRQSFFSMARRLGCPIVIVACSADPRVLASRIESRLQTGADASEATVEVLAQQLGHLQPFSAQEQSHVVAANTQDSGVLDQVVETIRFHTGVCGRGRGSGRMDSGSEGGVQQECV